MSDTENPTEPPAGTGSPHSSAEPELRPQLPLQLPPLDSAAGLINFRVLVSAKEAGCLIGQNGSVIDSIRDETSTRAGISPLVRGSVERILTVSGDLDNAAKALLYFAQAIVNALSDTHFVYQYFPLKQMLRIANVDGETTALRMLVPNAQIGTLIGARGARIQEIQRLCNVLMIASKLFLAGSDERLVELQGTVDNLYDALRVVGRCLLEDFLLLAATLYYVPPAADLPRRLVTETMAFRNDIVGALIGKRGLRIQGVRKVSGAAIAISDDGDGACERVFTITGTRLAVDKARQLLEYNLDREERRRAHEGDDPDYRDYDRDYDRDHDHHGHDHSHDHDHDHHDHHSDTEHGTPEIAESHNEALPDAA